MKTIDLKDKKYKHIPDSFKKMIGTEQEMSGAIFSTHKKLDKPITVKVLDVRLGSGYIMNMKNTSQCWQAIELLVKNDDMPRSRWTRSFKGDALKKGEF